LSRLSRKNTHRELVPEGRFFRRNPVGVCLDFRRSAGKIFQRFGGVPQGWDGRGRVAPWFIFSFFGLPIVTK